MWLVILNILGTLGGTLAVVVSLSVWMGKHWANRILQKQINNHNIELTKLKGEMQ
jgi:hypothetical protein